MWESKDSNGEISLKGLFNNLEFKTIYEKDNPVTLSKIAYLVCMGGWPVSVKADLDYSIDVTMNYYDGLFTIENERMNLCCTDFCFEKLICSKKRKKYGLKKARCAPQFYKR